MEFIIPTWLYETVIITYFLLLVVLTYTIIIDRRRYSTGQMLIMMLAIWFIPIAGPVAVVLASRRIRESS